MQRTHVYLPAELNREIDNTAKANRVSKAEVIREALQQGLKVVRPQKSTSARALLDIAEMAKKFKGTGLQDLSVNHDYYTWGGKKKTRQ